MTSVSLLANSARLCAMPPSLVVPTRGLRTTLQASQVSCPEEGLSLSHVGTSCLSRILAGLAGWGGGRSESLLQLWSKPGPQQSLQVEGRRQGGQGTWEQAASTLSGPDTGVPPLPHPVVFGLTRRERMGPRQGLPPSVFFPAACPQGRFGPSCAHVCKCGQGAACNPVTGTCTCPAGRTGIHCEHSECPPRWLSSHLVDVTPSTSGRA